MSEPVFLSARFGQALQFAFELHQRQQRKLTGTPYVAHLLGVTSIVIEQGGSENAAIAALLHDSVEDQGGPPVRAEIERRFGPEVAAIVDGCTDTDVMPKPPWRERKQAHVNHARTASADVRLVLAADKLHNVRSLARDYRALGDSLWSAFKGGRDGTLWYLKSMLAALGERGHFALLDEYAQALAEFETLLQTNGRAPA